MLVVLTPRWRSSCASALSTMAVGPPLTLPPRHAVTSRMCLAAHLIRCMTATHRRRSCRGWHLQALLHMIIITTGRSSFSSSSMRRSCRRDSGRPCHQAASAGAAASMQTTGARCLALTTMLLWCTSSGTPLSRYCLLTLAATPPCPRRWSLSRWVWWLGSWGDAEGKTPPRHERKGTVCTTADPDHTCCSMDG